MEFVVFIAFSVYFSTSENPSVYPVVGIEFPWSALKVFQRDNHTPVLFNVLFPPHEALPGKPKDMAEVL